MINEVIKSSPIVRAKDRPAVRKPGVEPSLAAKKPTGLGDLVAKVAQPIAGAIDAVVGTKLKGCKPCAQRQATLNRLIPDIRKPL